MLQKEMKFFVQVPDNTKRRVLQPAKVVEITEQGYTGQFEEPDCAVEAGQEIQIYYELRREFMKQAARVEAVAETESPCVFEFVTIGERVSAESRQAYRVSTVLAELTAALGKEQECPLLDVSATGFSVIAREHYGIGQIVSATLRCEGEEYTGMASIQSIKELSGGRIRYGLHGISDRKVGGNLIKGMQRINMAVQLQHLRRLSGAGV